MIFWIKMKFHQRNRREQQKVRDIPVAFSIVIFNFANVCWHSNQSLICYCFLIDRAMYQRARE